MICFDGSVSHAPRMVRLFTPVFDAPDSHRCPDPDLISLRLAKVRAAGPRQVSLHLALLPREHALLLLGALVFEVLPEVTVAARDLNILAVLRNALGNEVI